MIYNIPYIAVVALIGIGLYTVLFKKNLIKMIMGITLMENGANLFLITIAYRKDGFAPIWTSTEAESASEMVLPTAHALTLTSIVIGLATTALMLSFIMMIYKHYKTINSGEVRRCKE